MPPGRRFGKYLLHEKLAVGGMGELYLATTAGAAKGTPPSVLKILLPEYSADGDFVSMFHDEAKIGMQLAHPNIVSVVDLGRVSDTPYIVLEYVHGENLKNVLRRTQEIGEPFPPELAIRIAIEALHGLDYAHNAKDARGKLINLVHRDLSPDNVIVSFEGDVKVLDFGIAKAEGRATQTQFGILKGKAQYMAPEQAIGSDVDARTDLYAVGLVMLEVITGERRFQSDTDPVQQIRDARVWKPWGPSTRDPSLPPELDAIVLKALQSDPNRRWNSAEELSIALVRLLRDGKIPRSPENLPRFMRRLFPGRAEPYLTEDPTEGDSAEPSILQNTGDIELPVAVPVVRARASNASPSRLLAAAPDPNDVTTEGPAIEDTIEGAGAEHTADTIESGSAGDARTLIQPGRQIAPEDPEDRPTMPPTARSIGPPLPRMTPRPPIARRLPASLPLPEISATAPRIPMQDPPGGRGRFRPAVDDPRPDEELTNESDELGDGTRVGEFGGGTRVAPIGDVRARGPRASQLDPPSRNDPSAGERRSSARPPTPRRSSRPSMLLLLVLVATLFIVAAAAGALVFKDQLPPELRARIAALQGGGEIPAATSTPTAIAAASPIETVAASPTATATATATGTATVTATVTATASVPAGDVETPMPATTSQKSMGGGMFPTEGGESPTATPRSTPTPRPTPTARPTPTEKPTPAPRSSSVAKATGTPRAVSTAQAKDKALVRISSKPSGIEILLDGVGTGKRTPASVQVEPGLHTLSLKADGFKTWTFQEELKAGDTLQLPAALVPN